MPCSGWHLGAFGSAMRLSPNWPALGRMRALKPLKSLRFEQNAHEHTVYGRVHDRAHLLIGTYVDDLVITGSDHDEITRFKEEMKKEFLMSDLVLLSYVGMEVLQGRDGVTLNQGNYAADILDIAGLRNCNPTSTPIEE